MKKVQQLNSPMNCNKCGAPTDGSIVGRDGNYYCSTSCLSTSQGDTISMGPPDKDYDGQEK